MFHKTYPHDRWNRNKYEVGLLQGGTWRQWALVKFSSLWGNLSTLRQYLFCKTKLNITLPYLTLPIQYIRAQLIALTQCPSPVRGLQWISNPVIRYICQIGFNGTYQISLNILVGPLKLTTDFGQQQQNVVYSLKLFILFSVNRL